MSPLLYGEFATLLAFGFLYLQLGIVVGGLLIRFRVDLEGEDWRDTFRLWVACTILWPVLI